MRATGSRLSQAEKEEPAYRSLRDEYSHEYQGEHTVEGSPDNKEHEEFLAGL